MRFDTNPGDTLLEVPVANLRIGMYVAGLDRPWLETPFMVQGFYIRGAEDAGRVAEYCEFVFVDPRRFERPTVVAQAATDVGTRRKAIVSKKAATPKDTPLGVSFKDEYLTAKDDFKSAGEAVARVFETLKKGGHLDVVGVKKAIDPLIDSVLRNRDALAALIRMSKKDSYAYTHAISTAVWSVLLGRHLGFDKPALQTLALGSALLDIGKVKFPDDLLTKEESLTEDETALVREHVECSLSMIKQADARIAPAVLEVIRDHHERHDGSGYPRGLAGNDIPLTARIAGMADSYDAMTTARPYAPARSSFQAMQEFNDLKDVKFQGELVEQFMQAIGLFPTGSLVELNTGEVGIVAAQNSTRRLRPKVMVVLDGDKKPYRSPGIVDLFGDVSNGGMTAGVWIVRELAPGFYGLEAEDYYL